MEQYSVKYNNTLALRYAALFHDLGKELKGFQDRLFKAVNKLEEEQTVELRGDIIRHEVFSYLMFRDVTKNCVTNTDVINLFKNAEEIDFDKSAQTIIKKYKSAMSVALEEKTYSQVYSLLNMRNIENTSLSLRDAVSYLILTHHRLSSVNTNQLKHNRITLCASNYVNEVSTDDLKTLRKDKFSVFDIKNVGNCVWHQSAYIERLKEVSNLYEVDNTTIKNVALISRNAFLIADHLGSAAKELKAFQENTSYANTKFNALADTLCEHLLKVDDKVEQAANIVFNRSDDFNSLDDENISSFIKDKVKSDNERFVYQYELQNEITDADGLLVFAIGETGSGKTSAAAKALCAAKSKRWTVGLGLRSLAKQTAQAYVEDFKFRNEDVGYVVGGQIDDEEDNTTQCNLNTLDVEYVECDKQRELNSFVSQFKDAQRADLNKLNKLIESPILISTIDHIMPVCDARRSSHTVAFLRTLTSDVILDEIDSYSAEDFAAILRLAYIVGLYGRKLVVASATLRKSSADQLADAYTRGFNEYCEMNNAVNTLQYVVAGSVENSVRSAYTLDAFSALYSDVYNEMMQFIANKERTVLAGVLNIDNLTREETYNAIVEETDVLHANHHFTYENYNVSFGLLKLTRIKHVVDFVQTIEERDNTYTVYIPLHARYLNGVRSHIQSELSVALNRKEHAFNNAIEFLRKYRILDAVQQTQHTDIKIVVVSSPVIETGNDLDFDWAIVDPSGQSLGRSSVQTVGRVNRHRRVVVNTNNVSILSRPLIVHIPSVTNDIGLKKAGVEDITTQSRRQYKLSDLQISCETRATIKSTNYNIESLFSHSDKLEEIDARLVNEDCIINNAEQTFADLFANNDVNEHSMLNYTSFTDNSVMQFTDIISIMRSFRFSEDSQRTIAELQHTTFVDVATNNQLHIRLVNSDIQVKILNALYDVELETNIERQVEYNASLSKNKETVYSNYLGLHTVGV